VSGALSFAMVGALPALYGVALPVYARSFGLAEGQAGLLLSAQGTGAFAAVCAGMFGFRWLTMRLSLALLCVGSALIAAEIAWPLVLLGGLIVGAGFGLVSAIVNRRFLSEFGERGPGMVGLVNALFGIGAILAPLLFVLAGGAPRPVFAGVAVMALLLIPVVQPSGRGMAGAQGLPDLAQRRLGILAFIFFCVVVEVALFGFGPTALIAGGLPEVSAAWLTSAFFAAFLLARLSLYWLARRVGADWLLLLGVVGTAASAVLAALGWTSAGFIMSGAFVGLQFPAFYIWASQVLGRDPRMGSAVLAAGLAGAAVGPAVVQAGVAIAGFGGFFWVVAGLSGAVALALMPVIGRTRRMLALQ
jgi:MFS transporter, FHS family, glucose/mannose:H+ symporter